MTLEQFQAFVRANSDLLDGVLPESASDLEKYEASLGFALPQSMKWLLSNHGYSTVCGIDNLEDSVRLTQACRSDIGLPHDVLVINDWHDGGVVFAIRDDAPHAEYAMVWGDAADLHTLADNAPMPEDKQRFDNFAAWIVDRVQCQREQN